MHFVLDSVMVVLLLDTALIFLQVNTFVAIETVVYAFAYLHIFDSAHGSGFCLRLEEDIQSGTAGAILYSALRF